MREYTYIPKQPLFLDSTNQYQKFIFNKYGISLIVHQCYTEGNTGLNYADLAISCGYYDQSHMIKDYKKLTGKAPSEYLNDLLNNHYIDKLVQPDLTLNPLFEP